MHLRHILRQRHAIAAQAGTVWRAWRGSPAPIADESRQNSAPSSSFPIPSPPSAGERVRERGSDDRRAPRLARLALSLTLPRGRGRGPETAPIALPGPELTARVPAPPSSLIHDYLLHVGGDPAAYRGAVPPHLFLQWSLPLAARTLHGLPYPLLRILNAGCRIQINARLPEGAPLSVRAHLHGIEANERRAVLHQRIVTGTDGAPDALVADLYTVVPVSDATARTSAASGTTPPRADSRVPDDARELARWSLPRNAGLVFATLTGDINPIHWAAPYARAFGFPGPILHGFASLARAWEALVRARFSGAADRLRAVDVRFLRPLPLPANIGLYVTGARFFVGGAPGARATLAGTFEEATP